MQPQHISRQRQRGGAAIGVALLVLGASLVPAQAAGRALAKQTVTVQGVEVTVEGTVRDSRVTFSVELTTHEGDLTNDLSKSRLTVPGANFAKGIWRGDPLGGHHRSGTLTFSGRSKAVGAITLRLSGWAKAINLRWNAKGQPVR